ncbi:hypothetical protein LTS18_014712 [Coniosporium uncinatum]|uniref:Uncharacterized protein n=1 Tax=Coniosporium uncinatum TaxID=93489 RepID=A0ACC3DGL3_9PEZI|nr:hypothetical protein LTS18_014712 [Coniosporium uncinatum]
MCTGEQRTELYCGYCNKVMVLAKFSKVQRKSPDNAKCIICVEEQKAAEPDYNGAAVNSDDSNGDNDDDVDDDGCDSDNTLDYGDVTTNADKKPEPEQTEKGREVEEEEEAEDDDANKSDPWANARSANDEDDSPNDSDSD